MKGLLLLLLLSGSVAAQQVKGCKNDYDKFKDVTTYRCNGVLKTGFASQLIVVVHISQQGDAAFVFSTTRTDLRFLKNREMNLLLDGSKRISVNVSDTDTSAHYFGGLSQSLIFQIQRDLLEQITNAGKVEIKIGSSEGKFDDGLTKKLKAVVTATKSPPPSR